MIVCGIDPGREKVGIALVSECELLLSLLILRSDLQQTFEHIVGERWALLPVMERGEGKLGPIQRVYLGNGTGSSSLQHETDFKHVPVQKIDETGTTLQARTLYWRLHPPRGLWRLIPLALRVPPRPIDDLAAWAIALRGLVCDELVIYTDNLPLLKR